MRKNISCHSLLAPAAALLFSAACATALAASVQRVDTLRVPGEPLSSFDIGVVNDAGVYHALAPTARTKVST